MNGFTFDMTPYDAQLLPQIARALEERTELESRRKMPGLWKLTDRLRAKKEDGGERETGKAFLRSAKKLLESHAGLRSGDDRVLFATLAMTIRERGRETPEEISYGEFERAVETRDLYLLFFGGRVLALQKKDLTEGAPEDFRAFIASKTSLQTLKD